MQSANVGIVDPTSAWEALSDGASAMLIDVRTRAEWAFVGLPDLETLGKQTVLVEWQSFPTMAVNEKFAAEALSAAEESGSDAIYFLCRSGVRSMHAAMATKAAADSVGKDLACFNVSEGFEGDPDAMAQRGKVNGWKVRGLPWRQS